MESSDIEMAPVSTELEKLSEQYNQLIAESSSAEMKSKLIKLRDAAVKNEELKQEQAIYESTVPPFPDAELAEAGLVFTYDPTKKLTPNQEKEQIEKFTEIVNKTKGMF